MKLTGAAAVMQVLLEEQVEVIFGYPGGAIMPVYDAMMDSVPVVCITGQVGSSMLGTDAFQEADILSMCAPVTKWCAQITKAEEIPHVLAKAFHVARSGRPGPVLIDITKDAQMQTFEFSYNKYVDRRRVVKMPSFSSVEKAADLINSAKRPYILAGHGVLLSGAEEELRKLAEKADIPVASTLLGLSAFPTDHPLYAGMLGMHGNFGPNVLTNQADVIIAVGMRFDDRVTGALDKYAKQAKIIHIDIDESELDKNVKAAVPMLADAKSALQALLERVKEKDHPEWHAVFAECKRLEFEKVVQKEVHPVEGLLKMGEVVHVLSQKNKGEAILVTDVGQHQMIAARYHAFLRTNSHITSGGLGTMGFALPAAIGAKLGAKEREVIAVVGDGGFQMTVQELGVIAQENLPVKILILNNQYLGMVRQWQELFFDERYSFTEMHNPDFVKIAEAYGIKAFKVSDRAELDSALDEFLNSKEACLLEVVVENQHNVFPMIAPGASVAETRLE